ncbi:unnamed protein product [Durusdinium trenchii]|uniref:Uncharacterized protein n=1 Tax=Durusdinium trenchii TaxID=1381693 RepID=A0ABP0L3U4_9DINO
MVKGWNRSVCCLTTLWAMFELPGTFSCIYVTLVEPELTQVVSTNRGVSAASTLRRRPNCFNLLHQLQFLQQGGLSAEQSVRHLKAQENVAAFASAFSVGAKESQAAVNLLQNIPVGIKNKLTELARKYTQARFITHESLAMNLLNVGFNSASGPFSAWKPHLVNTERLLEVVISRMESDWVNLAPKMRKAWTGKDLEARFAMRHADHDILHMLEHSVPPADVTKVALFSSPLAKFKHETVTTGSPASAALFLLPQWHSSAPKTAVVKHRFAEWSGASWLLQRDWLTKEKDDKSVDIRYLGVYHDADAAVMKSAKDSVAGRMLSQWWDKSDEAGATSRPNATFGVEPPKLEVLSYSDHGHLRIPDVLQQKFKPSHGAALQACLDALADETAIAKALVAYHGGSPTTTSPTKADAPRTVANPDWQGEAVVNFRKRLHLSGVPITDFESSNSLDACAKLAREPSLEAAVTTTGHLFLVNKTEKDIALPAGELFGFNLGSFVEVASEHAATLDASLSWLVSDDKQLVALIKEGTDKELMSLAEVVCSVAKNKGITECKIIDHELQPKLKAHHV